MRVKAPQICRCALREALACDTRSNIDDQPSATSITALESQAMLRSWFLVLAPAAALLRSCARRWRQLRCVRVRCGSDCCRKLHAQYSRVERALKFVWLSFRANARTGLKAACRFMQPNARVVASGGALMISKCWARMFSDAMGAPSLRVQTRAMS